MELIVTLNILFWSFVFLAVRKEWMKIDPVFILTVLAGVFLTAFLLVWDYKEISRTEVEKPLTVEIDGEKYLYVGFVESRPWFKRIPVGTKKIERVVEACLVGIESEEYEFIK